jgi:hypothetical protein
MGFRGIRAVGGIRGIRGIRRIIGVCGIRGIRRTIGKHRLYIMLAELL